MRSLRIFGGPSGLRFPLSALLLAMALVPAAEAATTIYPHQTVIWDVSDGVFLPPNAYYGYSVGTARNGGGSALVGAPFFPAQAWLSFSGSSWQVDSQTTGLGGTYIHAFGRDGLTGGMVRASKDANGTYRISSQEGGLLISNITGGDVHSVAKFGTTLAYGQPFAGVGGKVTFYKYSSQFGWLLDRVFVGAGGQELGRSLVMLGTEAAFAGSPGAGANGLIRLLFSDADGGSMYTWIESPTLVVGGDARFGTTLALDGDWLAVGSPGLDRPLLGGAFLANVGGVYMYRSELLSWVRKGTFEGSSAEAKLGTAVDIRRLSSASAIAMAGAPGEATSGAAYMYQYAGGTWTAPWRLRHDAPTGSDWVGQAVAIAPSRLLVGAPRSGAGQRGVVLSFRIPLFADGFETGNTNAWSSVAP